MAENEDLLMAPIRPAEGRQWNSRWGGPSFGDDGGDIIRQGNLDIRVHGSDAVSEEARRYGYMAGGAQYRPGATIDPTRVDISGATERQARGEQMGSLGELSSAARGGTRDMQYLDMAAGGQSEDTWRLGRASAGETDDMGMLRSAGMGETADAQKLGMAADGQTEDMRLLGGAARGDAPSRAEILGKQMSDRALRSQVSAAGSVRGGPGASAAAYRYASQNAASQRADMNAGIQAERAAEMAAARHDYAGALGTARRDYSGVLGQGRSAYAGAIGDARRDYTGAMGAARGTYSGSMNAARAGYMGGASDIRGQDLGIRAQDVDLAKTQAGLDDAQKARNQQQEQFYEGIRSDTMWKGYEAEREAFTGETAERWKGREVRNAEKAQDWSKTKDILSMTSGAASGGAAYSDVRAKTGVQPVTAGSLAPLYTGGIFRTLPEEKGRQKEDRKESIVRDFPEGDDESPPKTREGWLDDYMAAERGPSVEKGAAGAPKGYAARRKGQPGYMFEESKPAKPAKEQMAPGTSDWLRYGTPTKEERASTGDARAKVQYRAKGGPVTSGQPYIVGEKGPELLVPETDGVVIPNEVIDAGEIDEPEDYRQPSDFRRDSPAEQGAVRARYFADLARQADEMKAGYAKSLARGASVVKDEGDVDNEPSKGPAPWLVAEMEGQPRDVTLSDAGAKIDAYLDGLKQGAREQKQGFADWDTADTSGYRKSLLISEARQARAAGRKTSKEAQSALDEEEKLAKEARAQMAASQAQAAVAEKNRQRAPATPRPVPSTIGDRAVERGAPTPVAPTVSPVMKPENLDPTMMSDKRAKTTSAEDAAMAGAARSMEPSIYAYKPEFAEKSGQKPGEVNVGPMAQNMAKDPVARTAIVKDGETGMLAIDKDKGMKVVMGSLASLQHQVDSLKKKKAA